jgi:hypothetical protein
LGESKLKSVQQDIIDAWAKAQQAMEDYGDEGESVETILNKIKKKLEEVTTETNNAASAAGGLGSALGEVGDVADDVGAKIDDILLAIETARKGMKEVRDVATTTSSYTTAKAAALAKNAGITITDTSKSATEKQNPRPDHTGVAVEKRGNQDIQDQKRLGLASDEVVRILKVGESVVPKDRNKGSIARNSDLVNEENENKDISDKLANWVDLVKESTQSNFESLSSSPNVVESSSNPVSVSIGDTIIQGNADDSVVAKLNEVKKSVVTEVFDKINKHTNLSGFRNVKRYV